MIKNDTKLSCANFGNQFNVFAILFAIVGHSIIRSLTLKLSYYNSKVISTANNKNYNNFEEFLKSFMYRITIMVLM